MSHDAAKLALSAVQRIRDDVQALIRPPSEISPSHDQPVLHFSLFKKCRRSYIEKIVHQINRTYSDSCYDACAVMIRRLVETLIIEVFEHHNIDGRLKDQHGDFKY